LHSSGACFQWAKVELAQQNSQIKQGSMTIMGRPELRLGYPVYVPCKDCFYYVKGIDHQFSLGGSFVTTLTLVAERAKMRDSEGVLKNGLFRSVGEIKSTQDTIQGTSNVQSDNVNNFVKQMYSPDICTPRAKERVNIVQPNFAIDMTKKQTDPISDWKMLRDIKVDQSSYANQDIQISDAEGYEIIGRTSKIYDFGLSLVLNEKGKIIDNDEIPSSAQITEAKTKAMKAIEQSSLVVNPNNNEFTLDQINNSMLIISNPDAKAKAQGLSDFNHITQHNMLQ